MNSVVLSPGPGYYVLFTHPGFSDYETRFTVLANILI